MKKPVNYSCTNGYTEGNPASRGYKEHLPIAQVWNKIVKNRGFDSECSGEHL